MNKCYFDLSKLSPGKKAYVHSHGAVGNMLRRLLDIGLIENTEVECVGISPAGGISAYLIRGAVIALRNEDAALITVYSLEK